MTTIRGKLMNVFNDVYNLLFQERLKATCLAGKKILDCREEPCSWKDIYEDRLKGLRVSEKTLASILKAWQDSGLITKVKAPFPYRQKYQLVGDAPAFEYLKNKHEIMDDWITTQNHFIYADNPKKLRKMGEQAAEEWMKISNEVFLTLLNSDFKVTNKGVNSNLPAESIAFLCYTLIDILLHSVVNLHGKSREEAKKIISEKLSKYDNTQLIQKKALQETNITDALRKKISIQ